MTIKPFEDTTVVGTLESIAGSLRRIAAALEAMVSPTTSIESANPNNIDEFVKFLQRLADSE